MKALTTGEASAVCELISNHLSGDPNVPKIHKGRLRGALAKLGCFAPAPEKLPARKAKRSGKTPALRRKRR